MEINIIPKFLDSALTPVAKEAGERLADIVSLVFTPVIKAKAKRDKNIELFLKELDDKVKKIPEEKLQNPPLHIVGPVVDNVFKFYHDEEYLRAMYSTLIASSMNSDNKVHPSYIEIIRQFSVIDANIFCAHIHSIFDSQFKMIGDSTNFLAFSITDIFFNDINIPYPLFYLNENKAYSMDISIKDSLQSLLRLGLIYFKKEKVSIEYINKYNIELINEDKDNILIYIYYYSTHMTDFGSQFARVCCGEMGDKDFFVKNTDNVLKIIKYKKDSMSFITQ